MDFLSCCTTRNGPASPAEDAPTSQTGGIGVGWEQWDRGFVVSKIVAGGPAHQSGLIEIGDILVNVNGQVPYDMQNLRRLLLGKPNTPVDLLIESSKTGAHLRITLIRKVLSASDGRISVQPGSGNLPSSSYSGIRPVSNFGSNVSSSVNYQQQQQQQRPMTYAGISPPPPQSSTSENNNNYFAAAARNSSPIANNNNNYSSSPSLPTTNNDDSASALYGVGLTFYLNHRGSWSVDSVQCQYEPATRIQPDDELSIVEGVDVEYAATEEIARLVLGRKDSVVKMAFKRGDETFEIPLRRIFKSGRK